MSSVQSFVCPVCCSQSCVDSCRTSCSIRVIDELLSTPGAVSGEEVDLLLDLRHLLRSRRDAELALNTFCELRRRLEPRHYLAFYRMRRWLENHIRARVRSCQAALPVETRLSLTFYCIEAVRRGCLCSAMQRGIPLLAPRLTFEFVPVVVPFGVPASAGEVPSSRAGTAERINHE